jgi:PHP family Zn ribbon phosphoesterase
MIAIPHNVVPGVRPTVVPLPGIADATRALRTEACAKCRFNFNWEACENIKCNTCSGRQRQTGGLTRMIESPNATCPEGLWNQ